MEKEELVETIEIWMRVKEGGEAYVFGADQNLKRIALLVNGYPLFLADGFAMERGKITKDEEKEMINRNKWE